MTPNGQIAISLDTAANREQIAISLDTAANREPFLTRNSVQIFLSAAPESDTERSEHQARRILKLRCSGHSLHFE